MFHWSTLIAVGLGGFVGANARFIIAGVTRKVWRIGWFPAGTVVVNLLGAFMLGFLAGRHEQVAAFPPLSRAFLFVGVLGSFTTFSTYSYETLVLFRDGRHFLAAVNALGQLAAGVVLAYLGYRLALRMSA